MSITTKKGDKGKTSLCRGKIVSKDDPRVEAFGTLDELCSFLGLSKSAVNKKQDKELIESIQRDLFVIGTELATEPEFLPKLKNKIDKTHVKRLEKIIAAQENKKAFTGSCFYLPGENVSSASLDVARAVTRRAERLVVSLKKKKILPNEFILVYLNRLSDLLYLLARRYGKNKLRKVFISVFIGIWAATLSLNPGRAYAQEGKTFKVLTSFYPMYIMALNVTKEVPGVSVENLTPPVTGCLHDYALTTADMKKVASADVFVANGAGMESFLDNVIARFPELKVVTLAEGVTFIKEGKEINPHVWVSLSNAIKEVNNLGKDMEIFDPVHAGLYRKNTLTYVNKLETLREKMRLELAPFKGSQIITFHEAFPYFAREFGFKIAAVIERNPGSEPNARELAQTIDTIKQLGIKVLFSEPQYPSQSAESISKETGAKVYTLDPAVTGPDDRDAYIKIMEENLKVLKQAFFDRPIGVNSAKYLRSLLHKNR